jgi:hypothetical protein
MAPPMPALSQVIRDHLELKQRNAHLESKLPLSRYIGDIDPVANHALFHTEEEALAAEAAGAGAPQTQEVETMIEVGGFERSRLPPDSEDSGFWTSARDFDWGD